MNPWETLGVGQDVAVVELRRRYAALIKEFRPETHPQDFARIRHAYELALPFARQRELPAAGEVGPLTETEAAVAPRSDPVGEQQTPQVTPGDSLPFAQDRASLCVEREIEISHETITVLLDADALRAEEAEPSLAAHFRRFHALAGSAPRARDEALLPELRALLQARIHATLDDSQELEFALAHWFIDAESPPLTLLFQAGRAFDWHHHVMRLSAWLSPSALRRMEVLLSMSRDLVYARHFSGNPWLRRLHSPRARWAPIARPSLTLDALRWAERWQHACSDSQTPALAQSLDDRTHAALRGRVLYTTDLWVGLMAASAAADLEGMAIFAVAGSAAMFVLRMALHAVLRLPATHRLRIAHAAIVENLPTTALMSAVMAMVGTLLMLTHASPSLARLAIGAALFLPAATFACQVCWNLAARVELYFTEGFAWRDAADRLEFDRFMRARVGSINAAPFGDRQGALARWRTIPAALRFEQIEIAKGARPPRPLRFPGLSTSLGQQSVPRLMWFGAWIVFAILRVATLIASKH